MKALLATAAAAAFVIATPAFASAGPTSSANANADAVIVKPISITKVTDLNFGRIAADTAASTVTIANDGTRTSSTPNVLIAAGSSPTAATFTVAGEPNLAYTASLAASTIQLVGATVLQAPMSAALTLVQGATALDGSGADTVSVGGALSVGANQASGSYHGTLTVNVQYN
jgi:hypothetical protein